MLAFVLRRLFQAALVMLAVAAVAFSLFRYVGDPVNLMLGQDATPEQKIELRASLGLDKPLYYQFAVFVRNAAKGEFGCRFVRRAPCLR
jgi:peptide/nickel transport system permease protein